MWTHGSLAEVTLSLCYISLARFSSVFPQLASGFGGIPHFLHSKLTYRVVHPVVLVGFCCLLLRY